MNEKLRVRRNSVFCTQPKKKYTKRRDITISDTVLNERLKYFPSFFEY